MIYALQTGLTIESTIGNKRVLHNGILGVYEDLKPVHANEVAELGKELANLKGFIQENTKHKVTTQTFGLLVSATVNQSEIGRAFIGYDEGVDFNLRLCYATDTFLAMELGQLIRNYATSDNKSSNFKVTTTKGSSKANVTEDTLDDATKTGDLENDYGWGMAGEQGVMYMLEERVTKLHNGFISRNLLTEKDGEQLRTSIISLLNGSKKDLPKGTVFTKGSTLYELTYTILDSVKVVIPNTVIEKGMNTLTWKIMNGETVLTVYDKELVTVDKTTAGSMISMTDSPAFKGIDKLLALLFSNVGYSNLIKKAGKVTVIPKEVKQEGKEKETKKEDSVQVQPTLSTDYYDMYLVRAGKWGKTDKKYKELKDVIVEVVKDYDITCATLRGLNDKEVVIDWVMDNKSYTMAITERATRVNELEVTYDTAIAYDMDYPEVLGVFIKEKLDGLKQSKLAVNA